MCSRHVLHPLTSVNEGILAEWETIQRGIMVCIRIAGFKDGQDGWIAAKAAMMGAGIPAAGPPVVPPLGRGTWIPAKAGMTSAGE